MTDEATVQRLQEQLRALCDKPPERVVNGSVQVTRLWMSRREAAWRLLNRRNATALELKSAISLLE